MEIFGFHIPWTKDQEARQANSPKSKATAVPKPVASREIVAANSSPQTPSPLNSPTIIVTGPEAARIRAIQEKADAGVVAFLNRLNENEEKTGSGLHDTQLGPAAQLLETKEEVPNQDGKAGKSKKINKPPEVVKPASEAADKLLGEMLHRKPRSQK